MDSDGLKSNQSRLIIPRGEKTVFVGGRMVRVHTPRSRTVVLPNGQVVKVSVDDSGRVTQVEDHQSLSAIARPRTIEVRPTLTGS
jgi:hypothetical protein